MKNNFCLFGPRVCCLLLILMMPSLVSADNGSDNMQKNLESAFTRAFNDPVEFRNAGIFQLLGYSEGEIAQIGRITPRPAAITVLAEPGVVAGAFNNIRVNCTKVSYYNLTIDRVVFDFPGCRLCVDELEQGRLRFLGSEQIHLKTEVSASDIARVFDLVARARSLTSLRIKLENERARINGRVKRGLFVVDFNITGDTELIDTKTVVFRCDRMLLNRAAVPRNTVNAVFKEINPVFDARKTWLNLNIAAIKIRQGFVETTATIERRKS